MGWNSKIFQIKTVGPREQRFENAANIKIQEMFVIFCISNEKLLIIEYFFFSVDHKTFT